MKATPQQQRDLLALGDIDEEIRLLEHRRANLPEQQALDETTATLEKVSAELLEATQRQQRLEAQSARHEREIATVESSRKTEEARMYSGTIQSEKMLEALKAEISALRRRKSDLEDSLLEIMEQLEDTAGIVETLTARREELQATANEQAAARDAAATDIDASLADARARREQAASAIPEELLAYYEQLRAKQRAGGAVARLERRACTGCRLELTAIELEEIKETAVDQLALCPQCSRIIVPA